MSKRPAPRKPWHPPLYEVDDIHAVQALSNGEATPDQQQRALSWIINNASMTYDEPFDPESARATDYVLGRRSVGLAIVKLLKLKPGVIARSERGPHDGRNPSE